VQQGSYSTGPIELRSALSDGTFQFTHGFVIVTHACDVVRARESLVVAGLVSLNDDDVSKYGEGKSPRYFGVSVDLYADFEAVATVTMESVIDANPLDMDPQTARAFRHAAARKWGRVAIPTHVDKIVKPLQEYFKGRAAKASFASMISRVKEIRIAVSPDWLETSEKDFVELTFLFEPGDLGEPDGSAAAGVKSEITAAALLEPGLALAKLADLLADCQPGSVDDDAVWEAIAETFARMVQKRQESLGPAGGPTVKDVIVTVKSKADMTVAEYEDTERLDLSHLSSDDEQL